MTLVLFIEVEAVEAVSSFFRPSVVCTIACVAPLKRRPTKRKPGGGGRATVLPRALSPLSRSPSSSMS